jgi:hypothetical protein
MIVSPFLLLVGGQNWAWSIYKYARLKKLRALWAQTLSCMRTYQKNSAGALDSEDSLSPDAA